MAKHRDVPHRAALTTKETRCKACGKPCLEDPSKRCRTCRAQKDRPAMTTPAPITAPPTSGACVRCGGTTKATLILGNGAGARITPCPVCRPEEYRAHLAAIDVARTVELNKVEDRKAKTLADRVAERKRKMEEAVALRNRIDAAKAARGEKPEVRELSGVKVATTPKKTTTPDARVGIASAGAAGPIAAADSGARPAVAVVLPPPAAPMVEANAPRIVLDTPKLMRAVLPGVHLPDVISPPPPQTSNTPEPAPIKASRRRKTLSPDSAQAIVKACAVEGMSQRVAAEKHGTSQTVVSRLMIAANLGGVTANAENAFNLADAHVAGCGVCRQAGGLNAREDELCPLGRAHVARWMRFEHVASSGRHVRLPTMSEPPPTEP